MMMSVVGFLLDVVLKHAVLLLIIILLSMSFFQMIKDNSHDGGMACPRWS